MKKKLMIIWLIAILAMSQFSITYAQNSTREATIDFPTVKLYSDGSYTPDTTMLSSLGISDDVLHNPDTDYRMSLPDEMRQHGFHDLYYDGYLQSWRISFTSIVDAPIIDLSNYRDDEGGISMSDEVDKIPNSPDRTARTETDMGLEYLYGEANFLLENDTDHSGVTYDYTDDFALSSYDVLYLDDIGDYGASNLSIVVSYVEDLSYADLGASNANNVTIFNEPVNGFDDLWFRLDLEATDESFDQYVANIEVNNFDIRGGKYIANVDSNVEDTRYQDNYIGDVENVVQPASASDYFKYNYDNLSTTNPSRAGLSLSSWIDEMDASDALSLPSNFEGNAKDGVNEIRGWDTAEELEDSIVQSIIDKSENDDIEEASDIDDLRLTSAILNFKMPATAVDKIEKALNNAADKTHDLQSAVNEVTKSTYQRVMILSDTAPGTSSIGLNGIFSDIANGITSGYKSALDTTTGAVGSVLSSTSSFATDIIGSVTGGTSDLIATSGGVINSGIGAVSNGASQVVGQVGSTFTPLLIVAGLIIGVVAIFYIRNMINMSN